MDNPSQVPPNLPTFCRESTTVLSSIVLAIAGLGFIVSWFGLLSIIANAETLAVFRSIFFINGALAVISKVALLVLGVSLIRRRSQVIEVARVGLTISLLHSTYYIIAVVPHMRSEMRTSVAWGFTFGAWISAVLSVVLYVGILIYLAQPASRQEFQRTNA